MNTELPPLPELVTYFTGKDDAAYSPWTVMHYRIAVEARERILQARIAELERLWQSAEDRYAEADAAAMAHAKRIAELEADAERYRWLRDKSPGHWTLQVGDLPLFKGDVDAAIDAAREAK